MNQDSSTAITKNKESSTYVFQLQVGRSLPDHCAGFGLVQENAAGPNRRHES
jgi:hypothetical protein